MSLRYLYCLYWLINLILKSNKSIFLDIEIQRCVIHQMRYPMTYVNSEDLKPFMTDLKSNLSS